MTSRVIRRWAGLAGALLIASALLLSGTAGARQAQAQAAISLDLPRNSPLIAGQLTAVEVSVTSQRAVRGVVSVSTSSFEFGGSTVYQVPVELAAGTPVEFPLAVVAGFGGLELQAELVVGGESVAQAELRRFGDEAPGVLAAVLGVDAPGAVEMRAGTGSATTYQVSAERLETVGLLGTSYLITSPGALRSLTQPALLAVITWTADGGQLLVVGAEGSADDLLPEAWTQGPAGLGAVSYVDDSWAQSGLSLPARTIAGGAGQIDPQMLMGEVPFSSIDDLASDAGFSLPSLRSLLVLLGVYALAAGPITYLVLKRMGSTHLAWRVLPLLAVVCTGMALVVGAGLRSDRGSSYASVVEVWPTGSKATTTILVSSARSDIRTVEAPQAWHYTGSGQIVGWGPTSEGAVSVEPGRTGVAVSSNLTAGGAASMQLTGPAPQFDGALTIDQIVLDGATVAARVTNNSGAQLSEVVALFGTEAVEIGELADGESRSFTIEHSARLRQRLDELATWGVNQFGGGPSRNSSIAAGVWSQWRGVEGLNAFPDGYVGVVGWSRDLEPPTSDISSGRTALVARAALPEPIEDGSPLPSLIVADQSSGRQAQDAFFFGWTFAMRIDAGELEASRVSLDLDSSVAGLEMWDGTDWIPVDIAERGNVTVGILPQALIDGSVYVRSTVTESWPVRPGVTAMVGEAEVPETREVGDVLSRWDGGGMIDPGMGGFAELSESFEVQLEEGEQSFEGDLFGPEYDEYRVQLNEGDELGIRLRADHDSLLWVRGPDGDLLVENDDFGGICCNSGADLTITRAGEYVIEARALGGNGSGGYELVLDYTPSAEPATTTTPTTATTTTTATSTTATSTGGDEQGEADG